MADANAPLRLGNYEPLLELASGGMATVYAARQLGAAGFERLVVVKRVHRHLLGNREFFNMFRDEARIAALIRHPNVVAVSDVVEADGELLLVMEYVEGSSLSTLRGAAREVGVTFPLGVCTRIAYDALAGLHAAHEATDMRGNQLDLVHRDVSPQNILVGVDGSSRVIDFGIAKARHRLTETKSGSLKGKYSYMAPEQTRGMPVDRRTDIFAWGVVLHELLTGERLFRGENEFDTMRRIWEAPIPPPSHVNPQVPRALDAVVLKALARDPAQRFSTAVEVLDALEHAAPLGSQREVAAFVDKAAGARLRERQKALHGMLEGRVMPLALDLPVENDESQTTLSTRSGVPAPGSSEGDIALAQRTIVEVPRPRNQPTMMIALVAVLVTIALGTTAIVVGVLALRHGTSAPASASSTTAATAASGAAATDPRATGAIATASTTTAASASAAPIEIDSASAPTSTAEDLAPGEVAITLRSDTPIMGVRARGMHRLEIQGNSARIIVASWTGKLHVDAVLQGGKAATASVPSGASSAQLVAARAATTTTTKPGGGGSGGDTNLQANPY